MTSVNPSQLTLVWEPSLPERFKTLRHYLAYRINAQQKSAKVIAADMDMSPSLLSRKLTAGFDPEDKDTQRLNCDDLENYLRETGDAAAVIEYLAAKFMSQGDRGRRSRALSNAERLLAELAPVLEALKSEDSA